MAQETFLRAYQHLGRYDESKPFDLLGDGHRSQPVPGPPPPPLVGSTPTDVDEMHESLPSGERSREEGVIAAEEHRSLESAMATLGPDDREVLAL